ncbi:hypothetical protein HY085_02915, partial [Candidatus Gottesmanbacteria bacterium]|nr:hypothetical protein [Candidatus Gottesmanbacteria bacterium]
RLLITGTIIFLFFLNIFYYLHQYFIHLPVEDASSWQFGYKELVEKVKIISPKYQDIYVTKVYDQPYIYFLLYGGFPATVKNPGNFSEGFDKYHFVDFSLKPEISKGQLLVLMGTDTYSETLQTISEIRFPDGSIAFRLAQRI